MAGLNTEEQATFQTLLELGCSETDARKAAKVRHGHPARTILQRPDMLVRDAQRFSGNVAAAANWIYDGAVEGSAATDDDAPPPLISTEEDELPHPSTLGQPPPYPGPELPPFGRASRLIRALGRANADPTVSLLPVNSKQLRRPLSKKSRPSST